MFYTNLKEYLGVLEKSYYNKFKAQLKVFNEFVTDIQWKDSLSFDMALFPDFSMLVNDIICEIKNNDLSEKRLDSVMKKLRNNCVEFLHYANETNDVVFKWLLCRRAYAEYGLVEVITEGSIITDIILNLLKTDYKDSYLEQLKKMDECNPSILTNFGYKSGEVQNELKSEKLYLLMKKWQDDQHLFHKNVLYPKFVNARNGFERYVLNSNKIYLKNQKGRTQIALYLLDNIPIIPVDLLSIFIAGGVGKELASVVGGKNMGLAILNSIGAKIPKTYAIPVGALNDNSFISKLKELSGTCFSVRSSATVEDNDNQSFAGMFTSVLNVKKVDLKSAVYKVYASLFNDRVEHYVRHFKTERPYMAVVIQSFKEPTISGVWIGKTIETGHLEWTTGNGEGLVSGKITPNYENWHEDSSVDDKVMTRNIPIGMLCIQIQKMIGTIADFEWCVINNEVIWLQYRPVTRIFEVIVDENFKNNKISCYGIAASKGKIIGIPQYLNEPENCDKFIQGNILLTEFTDPDWVPAILKSSAIVTAEGGFLSHTAIISREVGIPCVTGIGYENLSILSNAKKIEVDGNKGIVNPLE